MRSTVLALSLVALCACGKKSPSTEPAAAAAAKSGPAITAEMPDDASARQFAKQLVAQELTGLNPTGSSDFSLSITFAGDGTWVSAGHAELGGETLDCQESGTWRIDEMEGDKAVMDWTIAQTTCPNRSSGETQRVSVAFVGDTPKIAFR